ncbi:EAL domain-containing protein [Enterobacter chuandaensis]|uniref:EAL domain-containing protein n=3 Tax=Enterobacter chuandaensis TaxID=2497875 RepID=A0AA96M7M6_9ENTR|nr:EAL domain-containing protein [Enterobacter chuandaensis]MCW4781877.1 EAL domain-containing protein [Enterobacter chuandaensis]MDA4759729.1 EAL domain-containing protein [Enterobacter chuandaensis]WNS39075.1 EAL domain-containing protein [Enterobacter chuandaensis]
MTAQNLIDTPSWLDYFSQDIIGIKLEPIVALSSQRQAGVEVLSILSATQCSEDFFRHQSAGWSMTLLDAQLAALKNTPHGNNLFINLPITVLTEPASFQRLIALKTGPLNIELVDSPVFLTFPAAQKQSVIQNLLQLKEQGHRIWLDDIDEIVVQPFLSCRLPLSGIKIDKNAFWRLRATPALRQLVSHCFQLAGKVLIEGIETERDRTLALQAGADLGQGYYWPSWTWPED